MAAMDIVVLVGTVLVDIDNTLERGQLMLSLDMPMEAMAIEVMVIILERGQPRLILNQLPLASQDIPMAAIATVVVQDMDMVALAITMEKDQQMLKLILDMFMEAMDMETMAITLERDLLILDMLMEATAIVDMDMDMEGTAITLAREQLSLDMFMAAMVMVSVMAMDTMVKFC